MDGWRDHARESILDGNDGIVSAAGIAEGFASAGAPLQRGADQVRAKPSLLEAEKASIEADPDGEFEELVDIYESKGLSSGLARQVAQELTERDPAAHADVELHLNSIGSVKTSVYAAATAGLFYAAGAAIPLAAIKWLPEAQRVALTFAAVLLALGLTGWFASWLTRLPVLRLIRRNLLLGAATMAVGLLIGTVIAI